MSKPTSLKTSLKKFIPAAAGVGLVTLAGTASAADLTGAIGTAVSDAQTNLSAVATGLIAIAAIMMGVGIVVSAMKR